MSARSFVSSFAHWEGVHLSQLVTDFRELVGPDRDPADPAVARLTPSPYPDDVEAALAFADSTRDDLLDRRALDADTVRLALKDFGAETADGVETDPLLPRDVTIADSEIDAWLRTLTGIRLVLAQRLGIVADDQHDDGDSRFDVYDWLGYRLDTLIQDADRLDGMRL